MGWFLGCLMKSKPSQVAHDSQPTCAVSAVAYLLLAPPPQLSHYWASSVLFASTVAPVLCAHPAGADSSRP